MEIRDIEGAIEGILFAAGEPVAAKRIAAVLDIEEKLVFDTAAALGDRYSFERRGIRILRLDDALQMCSAPEYADEIRLALETRKPPQLSQTSLEVLAIVAYFQPVTRAYIEQVRGVDCGYTINLLTERGLIESAGRLQAPGRPVLYKTTPVFLRTFGISDIEELPPMPDMENEGDQMKIQSAIDLYLAQNDKIVDNTVDG